MPATAIRRAVRAYRLDRLRGRLDRLRGGEATECSVIDEHGWLVGRSASDALGEATQGGALGPAEAQALVAHRDDALRQRELGQLRDAFASLGGRDVPGSGSSTAALLDLATSPSSPDHERSVRQFEAMARDVGPRVRDAVLRARDHLARAPTRRPLPDGFRDDDGALPLDAEAFLSDTESLREEAVGRLLDAHDQPDTWWGLAAALEAACTGPFGARRRADRVATLARGFGFSHELSRVQLERPHPFLTRDALVLPMRPGLDVRLATSTLPRGIEADMSLARGVGRALGHCLQPPGAPFAVQHLPDDDRDGPRLLGALLAQLVVDPVRLHATRLSGAEREQMRFAGAAALVLRARWDAASHLLSNEEGDDRADPERATAYAKRATGVTVPPGIAQMALVSDARAGDRLRAETIALGAWFALRDRFDEDWYRNPRSHEALRASQYLARATSVEAWAAELGLEDAEVLRGAVSERLGALFA